MSRAVILCRGEHESNLRGILQEGHLFGMEGQLFDREGHLFNRILHLLREGSQFCYKLLGGQNFDHVYDPLPIILVPIGNRLKHM